MGPINFSLSKITKQVHRKTYTHMVMIDKITGTVRSPFTVGEETTTRSFHRRRGVGKLSLSHVRNMTRP